MQLVFDADKALIGGDPVWDEDGTDVVTIQVGQGRASEYFFELQRYMEQDPQEDSGTVYLLHGDFIHAANIDALEVEFHPGVIELSLNQENANGFDGINKVTINHKLNSKELEGVKSTLVFMFRNLDLRLRETYS